MKSKRCGRVAVFVSLMARPSRNYLRHALRSIRCGATCKTWTAASMNGRRTAASGTGITARLLCLRRLHYSVEKHVRARFAIRHRDVLALIVAEPALARDEDHGCWSNTRDV